MHAQDYTNPNLQNAANSLHRLDPKYLRASHFSLGDKSQEPNNHYSTTYSLSMNPKDRLPVERPPNNNFKSSLVMNGDGTGSYITESRAK